MIQFVITRCEADYFCLFHSPGGCIYLVYVDDIGTSEQDQDHVAADVSTFGNNDMEGGAELVSVKEHMETDPKSAVTRSTRITRGRMSYWEESGGRMCY